MAGGGGAASSEAAGLSGCGDRRNFSGIRRESGATPTVGLSVGDSGGSLNGTAKRRAMCAAQASGGGSDRRSFSGIRRESGATPTVGLSVGNSGGSQYGTAKRRAMCAAQASSDAIPGGDRGRRTGSVPQPPTCPKARVGEPWLRGRGRGGTLALLINKGGESLVFWQGTSTSAGSSARDQMTLPARCLALAMVR